MVGRRGRTALEKVTHILADDVRVHAPQGDAGPVTQAESLWAARQRRFLQYVLIRCS